MNNLTIDLAKIEQYKIKVGAEVYRVNYPSWDKAIAISKEVGELKEDGEKLTDYIRETLIELGLDEKFFNLNGVNASHIFTIWQAVNGVKK